MAVSRDPLPFAVRAANAVGGVIRRFGLGVRFDSQRMMLAAEKTTRLDDWGDLWFLEDLERLLVSAEDHRTNLSSTGRLFLHRSIVHALTHRLRLQECVKTSLAQASSELSEPPIIIVGLPRSGTTFLHRMLCADRENVGIPGWLMGYPFEFRSDPEDDRAIKRRLVDRVIRLQRWMTPEISAIHHTDVDEPVECTSLLGASFVGIAWWGQAPLHDYVDWWLSRDRENVYVDYEQSLRLLHSYRPGRLVMKSPLHTGSVRELSQKVSGVRIIQLHRHPGAVLGSVNSLYETLQRRCVSSSDLVGMAATNERIWEHELRRNLAARGDPGSTIHDVLFEDLVADPVGTVRRIYERFDLAWTDELERAVRGTSGENVERAHGPHDYNMGRYGLDSTEIEDRFSFYLEQFPEVAC